MSAVSKLADIVRILDKYEAEDYQELHDTANELLNKGFGNGCFQNTAVALDLMTIVFKACDCVKEFGDD